MNNDVQTAASGPLFLCPRGRLAPSPTGLLHLGNAWAFMLAWLAARSSGGEVVLRIEDIDTARSRPAYTEALLEDLLWLGLDWDIGPGKGTQPVDCIQSERDGIYRQILHRLRQINLVYPCFCTRRELKSLPSAPHSREPLYPGTCASLPPDQARMLLRERKNHSWRFRCGTQPVCFRDSIQGPQKFWPEDFGGDFALERGDGLVSYQLACAVDDALMGINQVVRGRDLLSSTPRQILLQQALGLTSPQYAHIPMLLNENGERLAKRHSSLSLARLRETGVAANAVIGLLAYAGGLRASPSPLDPRELVADFKLARVAPDDIRLTGRHLAWLVPGAQKCAPGNLP